MSTDPLYQTPIRRVSSIGNICSKLKPNIVGASSIKTKIIKSLSASNLQALSASTTNKEKINQQDLIELIDPNSNGQIEPGMYPQNIEASILSKMKTIAIDKSIKGMWLESHHIFKSILNCQEVSLGAKHPQVANTLYYIGIALNNLGKPDAALVEFEKGIEILYPTRYKNRNLDLALLYFEIGMIFGDKKSNFDEAIYYLDLSKQVEKYVLGESSEKTCHMIKVFEYRKFSPNDVVEEVESKNSIA